jgi:hypothetical protein
MPGWEIRDDQPCVSPRPDQIIVIILLYEFPDDTLDSSRPHRVCHQLAIAARSGVK